MTSDIESSAMKCPQCWTEKAYRHPQQGWKAGILKCLGLVSMKCHHCYHKFHTLWLATLGQTVLPPRAADTAGQQIIPKSKPSTDNEGRHRRRAA